MLFKFLWEKAAVSTFVRSRKSDRKILRNDITMASESTISVLSDVSDFNDVPFSPLTIHDVVENVLHHQPMRYVNGGHVCPSVR